MYAIVTKRSSKIVYQTYYPMCETTPWSADVADAGHWETEKAAAEIAAKMTLGGKFGDCWAVEIKAG